MRVGVLGAGSIGAYVGARLVAAGVPSVLVGRASLAQEVAAHGLHATSLEGFDRTLSATDITVATDARALAGCDVVLVTVKGLDTRDAALQLKPQLKAEALVVSFQNGVRNRDVLAEALGPSATVIAGMVGFNVLKRAPGHFHQGTSGRFALGVAGGRERWLVDAMNRAGLLTSARDDIERVLWGKLLVNLNNSVNALAGIPLAQQLRDREYRRVMAACVREAVGVLRAARIRPALDLPLPPSWLPSVLELPDWLFTRLAKSLVNVDPNARSSMWEDLQRGRKTEVDLLNGEIVALGQKHGLKTPFNTRIMELVKSAENGPPPSLSADYLRQKLFS